MLYQTGNRNRLRRQRRPQQLPELWGNFTGRALQRRVHFENARSELIGLGT
jgi:hypothetical protein